MKKNEITRKFMRRFAAMFVAVVCLSQVARADDPQGIVNSINSVTGGYDLVATISDNTVTVTGTLYGVPDAESDFLTLNINAGVTVIWQATLSGSLSQYKGYSRGNAYSLINISGGSGVFEVQNGGNIENTGYGRAITNNSSCTVNISGGAVNVKGKDHDKNTTIYNASTGTVNVSGGTVSGCGKSAVFGVGSSTINNASTGTINILGGTVSADGSSYTICNSKNDNGGTINISGGTVSAKDGTAIVNSSGGTVKIVGGIVSAKGSEKYNTTISGTKKCDMGTAIQNFGNTIISGGTISSSNGAAIRIIGGTLEISGDAKITAASVSNENGTIYLDCGSASTLNINGGTVENTDSKGKVIYNPVSGSGFFMVANKNTINISGGTILARNVAISNGDGGNLNISGGTISTSGTYNQTIGNGGNAKITGGIISAPANTNSPAITNGGTLTLGGNPAITGKISVSGSGELSVITTGHEAFTPDQKTYTLLFKGDYGGAYAAGKIAVTNGREFLNNFKLDTPDWVLTGSTAHLAIIPAN